MRKTISLLFIICIFSSFLIAQAPTDFVTTWKTDNNGVSNATSILLPISGGTYDIDWTGDGTWDDIGITGAITHDYGTAGTYEVWIQGDFNSMKFSNAVDKEKILTVNQWGSIAWNNMNGAFFGCKNLQVLATDAPDLSGVTDFIRMFRDCSSLNNDFPNWVFAPNSDIRHLFYNCVAFNGNLSTWNTSGVVKMGAMFSGCTVFNQDLNSWNTSNVTDMTYMFQFCKDFNGDITSWDVSKVVSMDQMFRDCIVFNQNIGGWTTTALTNLKRTFYNAESFDQDLIWNTAGVTDMTQTFFDASIFNGDISGWETSEVLNMSYMFTRATLFNQNIGSWNVGKVTTMTEMFRETADFNQDIGGWNVGMVSNMFRMFWSAGVFDQNIGNWNVSQVSNMGAMFYNVTLSTANYDALLMGWDPATAFTSQNSSSTRAASLQSGVVFDAGNSKYCQGGPAKSNIIANNGWTIADGGEEPGCVLPVSLVDFKAVKDKDIVDLSWETASEINSSHFDIEFSTDNDNWEVIGAMDAQRYSTSLKTYHFQHEITEFVSPFKDQFYYRLVIWDLDGKSDFSSIQTVKIDQLSNLIKVYPNPANNELHISLNNLENEPISVEISNITGQTVHNKWIEKQDNANFTISNLELNSGIYLLNISQKGNSIHHQKIIIE